MGNYQSWFKETCKTEGTIGRFGSVPCSIESRRALGAMRLADSRFIVPDIPNTFFESGSLDDGISTIGIHSSESSRLGM